MIKTNATNKLSCLPVGSAKYDGFFIDAVKHIESVQLMDAELWTLFVNQFRLKSDAVDTGWRGEYWGKMMRGGAMTYAYSQNSELYNILQNSVLDLLSTQEASGKISTYTDETELRVFLKAGNWDMWGRKYVMLGLMYFMNICEDEKLKGKIIKSLMRHADYIIDRVGNKEGQTDIFKTSRFFGGMNSSSILEPFVKLYVLTGEQRYLDFSSYIVSGGCSENGNIFKLALEDKLLPFQYPVTKAYEMMSCFEGLLEYYRVTKIEKYKAAVINFLNRILESDFTAIGCAGCTHELFDNSSKMQTEYSKTEMQETCVTVTLMKLCFKVFLLTGDTKYADAIEVSAYNALLGAVNIKGNKKLGGMPFDSYSPLFMNKRGAVMGGRRDLQNGKFYGCCACIGSAGTALFPLAAVLKSHDSIFLNFYLNGDVTIKTDDANEISLAIRTQYPYEGGISIGVTTSVKMRYSIALRIPSFFNNAIIKVNGVPFLCENKDGWHYIDRIWETGNTIDIEFELKVKVTKLNNKVMLSYGAIVLARDNKTGGNLGEEVDFDINNEGFIDEVSRCANTALSRLGLCVESGNEKINFIDYASAGSDWDDQESLVTVWMPQKNNTKS